MSISRKSNPKLWQKVKNEVLFSSKGGKNGQWSARKAQIATKIYKERGGSYIGSKEKDNSLQKWTDQDWQYAGEVKKSRYLPKKAIEALTPQEKGATNLAKRKGTKAGHQHVKQPKRIAKKTAKFRK